MRTRSMIDYRPQVPPWREQIVLARGGEADVVLPIAYNDHPGACSVSVTDILAPGARATAEFRVTHGE